MRTGLNHCLGSFQPEEVIVVLGEFKLWHGIAGKLGKRILKDINLLLLIFFKQTLKLYLGGGELFRSVRSKALR